MKSTYIDILAVGRLEVDYNCRVRDTVAYGLPSYTTEFYIQSARFIDSGLSLPTTEFHWVADEMYDLLRLAISAGEIETPDHDNEDWTLDHAAVIEDWFSNSK